MTYPKSCIDTLRLKEEHALNKLEYVAKLRQSSRQNQVRHDIINIWNCDSYCVEGNTKYCIIAIVSCDRGTKRLETVNVLSGAVRCNPFFVNPLVYFTSQK